MNSATTYAAPTPKVVADSCSVETIKAALKLAKQREKERAAEAAKIETERVVFEEDREIARATYRAIAKNGCCDDDARVEAADRLAAGV